MVEVKTLLLAAVTFAIGASGPSAPEPGGSELTAAIRSSLRYLQQEGDRWMRGEVWVQDGQACVSCHHVGYALWSHHEAARAGVDVPPGPIGDLRRRAIEFLAQPGKPRIVSATQMIMAEAHSEAELELIRSDAKPAGNWRARGQFPTQKRGEEEGDAAASLWLIAALDTLERKDGPTMARRSKGLGWMTEAEAGISTEWTAARLVVAAQEEDGSAVDEQLHRLLSTQNDDGGWSWLEGDPSNPFSTGQTIYALATVGDARAKDAIRRGIDYLLAGQRSDGSWETPSRLTSEKPSEKKDTIYRYWGTAWACLGLSRARGSR